MRYLIKLFVQFSNWLNRKYPDQMPAEEARQAIVSLQKQVDDLRNSYNLFITKTSSEIATIKIMAGLQKVTMGEE